MAAPAQGTVVEGRPPLVERVKRILLDPKREWLVIDAEPDGTSAILAGYVAPLALISAIAMFIGLSVVGYGVPLVGTVRLPVLTGVEQALVKFAGDLAGIYILAHIIDRLAPAFGAERSFPQALKLAAYASTAGLLAGIFAAVPGLRLLGLLGLYSLYLFYLGVPILMKAPQDRALVYTATVIVAAIVLALVVGAIARGLT